MKKSYILLASTFLFVLGANCLSFQNANAQTKSSSGDVFSPGVTNFALLGEFDYGMNITKNSASFGAPEMAVMPLYRQGRFFFESGIGASFDNNGPALDVGPINLSYMLSNDWLIRVGHFDALPFGRYPRTYDPGWINPLATGPVGFDSIGGYDDFGFQVQGSGFIGNTRLRAFASITNGPQLSLDPGSQGMITSASVADNNKSKMIGGRLSLNPSLSSNFSIGVSEYYTGNVGNSGTQYDGVGANLLAVDMNWAPTVTSLDGFIRLRGQLNAVHVDKANYVDGAGTYTFKNNSSALYGMFAYQPSMSSNHFLQSLMFAFMYSRAKTPSGAKWDLSSTNQYDVGLTYWFNWRTNLKADYDIQENGQNALMLSVAMEL
ncbi:MAG TPA: hypothetical protein VKA34_09100 [Balneolales bacterium]|nr:hypothetical protein [Balneolales bacterium]